MGLFDEFTDAEIDALLSQTLKDAAEMPKTLEQLIGHWHAGEADLLDKLLNEEMQDGGEKLRELLLTSRNENWIPEIEKALKGSKNVMFLVGAGHLVGKDGVVELLRKKGHTVEKVKPAGKSAPAELKKAA